MLNYVVVSQGRVVEELAAENAVIAEATRKRSGELYVRVSKSAHRGRVYCRSDDVFVGFDAIGVVKPPKNKTVDWLREHCWVCEREISDMAREPGAIHP